VLFAVSGLIGLGVAIYEVAFPLYAKDVGFSWTSMGWIYSVAALLTFLIRVGMGTWSDRAGRKVVYVVSLLATGAARFLTPFFRGPVTLGALRCVAEPTAKVRDAMHSVLLYEDAPESFRSRFSKTRGVEFLFHSVGLVLAGWSLAIMARSGVRHGHAWIMGIASLVLIVSGIVFGAFYRERSQHETARAGVSWRQFLHSDLNGPMWIMTISIFVFTFAVMISHGFALQWFFMEKFDATQPQVFRIGALHRVGCAIPLLFFGHVFRRNLKLWLAFFLVTEGIFIALPGLMPRATTYRILGIEMSALWTAVGVWLVHDILGMGVWLPIQHELLQRHSRASSRGRDISLATGLGALGGVASPLVAGWLRELDGISREAAVNLPFLVSGAGIVVSSVFLLWLPREREE